MVQSLPLFGSPLVTALARSSFTTPSGLSIPGLLGRIFHEIEEKGLDIEGIFRKSGSTAIVNQLQSQFEENQNPFLVKFPSTVSTHSLAGLFKRYLQQLPEPVIPRHHQPLFLDLFDQEKCTKETLKRKLKEVCKTLPHEHLHLLQFLIEVADLVQQHKDRNQMSAESLAIIFAPTCVRIDGVATLMPSASINSMNYYPTATDPSCPSFYTSLPALLNNNSNKKDMFRKARKLLWNTLRKKTTHSPRISFHEDQLLYKPNDLLQLELVKESNTWIRIFEFMMSCPEVFTTLTNPLKSRKYQHRSMQEKKKVEQQSVEKLSSPVWKTTPFTQQEKKMLLMDDFKFTESQDLIKTFEKFDVNFDHILHPHQKKKKPSISIITTPLSNNKYVETLSNWRSREEENPTVVVPKKIQPPLPPSSECWVIESNEKKRLSRRQTLLFNFTTSS